MVEYINEPVSVEVQACRDGTARPMAFVWRGQRYAVEAWGRERSKTEGERPVHCHMVQTAALVTWELCQEIETAQWTLTRHWARKYLAV
jgi:hypothetical protein